MNTGFNHCPAEALQTSRLRADISCVAISNAQKQASAARRAENRARGQARPHARVRARPIHPHSSYKVTKRCLERRLFLTPGHKPAELLNLIGYLLAHTANEHGIQIHSAVFMSNHYHIDVTDPRGELVAWKQLFNSTLARALNGEHGRSGAFWANGACDTLRPTDDATFMDLVYTIANPVTAGLVKWSRKWQGFTTADWRFGETRTFKRPEDFFDPKGDMPEKVSLTLVRPPIFLELDDDALYEKLAATVREKEREIQTEFRARNRKFMGPSQIARQKWYRQVVSYEKRFTVTPKVAASCKWRRLAQLQRDREWEREYAAARASWLAGDSAAVFPAGTYWLRRFAGVTVAPHPVS
ncbi:hypothetical protein ENSA7_74500 [Enhygromyxa salina]|uniref:Transposase IS200-like domain-containing protein n=1 Tax=Enhygromyxa salina TaxID=215803 RepID=A0A2S9XQK7_9BACT|nr:hypothetical protein ENSA7_74500 [Enhygromyxa salina]